MTTAPQPVAPSAPTHLKHGYSSAQIAIHWTVAALVLLQWLTGSGMEYVWTRERIEDLAAGEGASTYGPAYVHITLGVIILAIMIWRLGMRLQRPVAVAPDSNHPLLARLGRYNHLAFYTVLLAMPPLGMLAWFGDSRIAAGLHSFLAWLLPVLAALHVGGALYHHFWLRDGLIRRMLRPT